MQTLGKLTRPRAGTLVRLAYAAGSAIALALPAETQAQPFEQQWKLVDEGLGRGGTTQPDGISLDDIHSHART